MKKFLSLLLVLCLLLPALAIAEVIDLSALSFDQLIQLRQRISQELTTRPEWKEVTVPQGVWEVGEDIPAGHWTISAVKTANSKIIIGTALDNTGHDIDSWNSDFFFWKRLKSSSYRYFDPVNDIESIDFELKDGMYVIVEDGPVVFSPFAGKPSLGF